MCPLRARSTWAMPHDVRCTIATLVVALAACSGGTARPLTDSGVLDGGQAPDGGTDAGASDGGALDAGTFDAGTFDAGSADGGTPDTLDTQRNRLLASY